MRNLRSLWILGIITILCGCSIIRLPSVAPENMQVAQVTPGIVDIRTRTLFLTWHGQLEPAADRTFFKGKIDVSDSDWDLYRDTVLWLSDGRVSPALVKATDITILRGKKVCGRIRDRHLKAVLLENIYRKHLGNGSFFYACAANGHVIETRGLGPFLKKWFAAVGKSRHTGVSSKIGKAAREEVNSPFILMSPLDVASPFLVMHDLYRYATKDERALKILERAPSVKDRCLMPLTVGCGSIIGKSPKAQEVSFRACKEVFQRPRSDKDIVQSVRAMETIVIWRLPHNNKASDVSFVLAAAKAAGKKARTESEKRTLADSRRIIGIIAGCQK